MKIKTVKPLILGLLFFSLSLHVNADEGMWLLSQINKSTYKTMKHMGLSLKAKQLYNLSKPSLKDAIVSFGGFCSGVIVSSNGLVLTNHHCGLDCVQEHSTKINNYLNNGFVAHSLKEELPNPDLFIRILLYSKDVTHRINHQLNLSMSEHDRNRKIDSLKVAIVKEVTNKDSTLTAEVDSYFGGNEFYISVYRTYRDIRLVFAPPFSIGQFGGDTDNWVWPRHNGDLCVFRIYANKNNDPADYSPNNVPYHPSYVVPISMKGYQEGSFCMTIGYPGLTERYLSSYGIKDMVRNTNQTAINFRSIKQNIWKDAMAKDESIRIKYISKYNENANYLKNCIGVNKSVTHLNIIKKRQDVEKRLLKWMLNNKDERHNSHLFSELKSSYEKKEKMSKAISSFEEAFYNGSELLEISFRLLNFDFNADSTQVKEGLRELIRKYNNYDSTLDKKVFLAMLNKYRSSADTTFLPDVYQTIDKKFNHSTAYYTDSLYKQSKLTTIKGLKCFINRDTTYHIMKDPAISLCLDLMVKYFDMWSSIRKVSDTIVKNERILISAMRRMCFNHILYPDANSTMRLSYGTVDSYLPSDGVKYDYYTTAKGILEKVKMHHGDRDFVLNADIAELLENNNYGQYADRSGDMNVCFISNNDITGGNSGSAMFNGKGELIGLAFDGNWEAMSSDLKYEPQLQRCIGVDIRYILFLIDRYGKADYLLNELQIHH